MVDNVGRLILRLANTSFLSTDIKKRSKLLESQRSKVHESFYFTAISYLQPEEFKISCPDFFPALRVHESLLFHGYMLSTAGGHSSDFLPRIFSLT